MEPHKYLCGFSESCVCVNGPWLCPRSDDYFGWASRFEVRFDDWIRTLQGPPRIANRKKLGNGLKRGVHAVGPDLQGPRWSRWATKLRNSNCPLTAFTQHISGEALTQWLILLPLDWIQKFRLSWVYQLIRIFFLLWSPEILLTRHNWKFRYINSAPLKRFLFCPLSYWRRSWIRQSANAVASIHLYSCAAAARPPDRQILRSSAQTYLIWEATRPPVCRGRIRRIVQCGENLINKERRRAGGRAGARGPGATLINTIRARAPRWLGGRKRRFGPRRPPWGRLLKCVRSSQSPLLSGEGRRFYWSAAPKPFSNGTNKK